MAHDNHAHDHAAGGESHGTVKSYLIGFVLAVVLTVIPFYMVMSGDFSRTVNGVVIAITAVLQMLVHLVFFLHLDRSAAQRNNVIAFVFAALVIVLLVGLSLWIMFSIHSNMMAH